MEIAVVYRRRGTDHRRRGRLRHPGARRDNSAGRAHCPRRPGIHLHRGGRMPAIAVRLRRDGCVHRRDPRRGSVASLRAGREIRLAVRNASPTGWHRRWQPAGLPRSLAWPGPSMLLTGKPWRRRAATRPRELCAWKWKQRPCSPSAGIAASMWPPGLRSAITFLPRIAGPTPSAQPRSAKPQSGCSTPPSTHSTHKSSHPMTRDPRPARSRLTIRIRRSVLLAGAWHF